MEVWFGDVPSPNESNIPCIIEVWYTGRLDLRLKVVLGLMLEIYLAARGCVESSRKLVRVSLELELALRGLSARVYRVARRRGAGWVLEGPPGAGGVRELVPQFGAMVLGAPGGAGSHLPGEDVWL